MIYFPNPTNQTTKLHSCYFISFTSSCLRLSPNQLFQGFFHPQMRAFFSSFRHCQLHTQHTFSSFLLKHLSIHIYMAAKYIPIPVFECFSQAIHLTLASQADQTCGLHGICFAFCSYNTIYLIYTANIYIQLKSGRNGIKSLKWKRLW